jgi:hypothetical protein
MSEPNIQQHESKLILAGRVLKTAVYGKDGTHLGHVDDLSIERESGRCIYGVMSFGGFLGIGERFHPVPWQLLDYDRDKAGFVIPMGKEELEAAPHYDRSELEPLGDATHADYNELIFAHYARYGVPPYW